MSMDDNIFQESLTLLNCCPKITRREVAEIAEISTVKNAEVQDFAIELVWDAHRTVFTLEPQATRQVRSDYAKVFAQNLKYKGLALIDGTRDETKVRVEALEAAIAHLVEFGSEQIALTSMTMNDDQMKRLRTQFQGHYMNQAREGLLRAELDRLTGVRQPVTESGQVMERPSYAKEEDPQMRTSPCGKKTDLRGERGYKGHILNCNEPACLEARG